MVKQMYSYYEFGEFRLDARKRVLLRNGELVHLTLKVFQLLLVLVENSGKILEKDELMESVWHDTIVEESNLKNSISTLRKALGEERGTERFIQTLPKRGYRFVAPVTLWSDEDETYLIEKRTTAEIIIDELADERKPVVVDEMLKEGGHQQQPGFAANTEMVRQESVALSGTRMQVSEPVNASQTDNRSALRGRNRKALAVSFLLVAALGLSIGLTKWLKAGKTKPAYAFDNLKLARLTNVGNGGAVISPDGKYIAYIMYGTPSDGLWVKQTATESAIKLLPPLKCWGLTFTPDSNYVYCILAGDEHPSGALFKVPALGGAPKRVLEGIASGVSFSPDGKRMIFKRINPDSGRMVLVTANANGSDQHIIHPGNSHYLIWTAVWSPDGKAILFSVKNSAVDGQDTWQVLEIPAEGGVERPITSPQKEAILSLTWLPDGSGLITIAVDKVTELPQLWHLSYRDGQATRIINDSNSYTSTSLTADGATILAQRTEVTQSVWMADASDLTNLRKITADQGSYDSLSWTPDGRILHAEKEDGKSAVWLMNADGTARQRLTDDHSRSDEPAISSDSRYVFFSSSRSGNWQIWRINSDGQNPRQLTSGADACYQPKLTADGQWVIYLATTSTPAGWVVRKVPVEGGESVTLADQVDEFAVSPDGKWLAYQSVDEQKKRRLIYIKPLEGDEAARVLDFPEFPIFQIGQWAKDGLLCITANTTQIVLLPVDGRQPRQLTDFKTSERIYSFALSLDGKQMALVRGNSFSEPVQLTNFKEN